MENHLLTVLFIVLSIWFGIFVYIIRIDLKVSKLEKKLMGFSLEKKENA